MYLGIGEGEQRHDRSVGYTQSANCMRCLGQRRPRHRRVVGQQDFAACGKDFTHGLGFRALPWPARPVREDGDRRHTGRPQRAGAQRHKIASRCPYAHDVERRRHMVAAHEPTDQLTEVVGMLIEAAETSWHAHNVRLGADRPFGGDRRALILHPHLLVVVEPTGTEDHPATSPDQFRLSGFRRIGIAIQQADALLTVSAGPLPPHAHPECPRTQVQMRLVENADSTGVDNSFSFPHGLSTPAAQVAMIAQRYMHLSGATSKDFGAVSVADRKHAARNPKAYFYEKPITIEDHQNSRWIAEPLRLLDCCQETDGAVALVVTSAERAKDLKNRPAIIEAASQGSSPDQYSMVSCYRPELGLPEMGLVGKQLWSQSGPEATDIQTAILYDHFTPFTLIQFEELGFCGQATPRTISPMARSRSAAGFRSTPTAASWARRTSTA